MALKRRFTDEERYGLTQEEINVAEKYLRKHKTAGALNEQESLKLFELYLIGASFTELSNQFPQYPIEATIDTVVLNNTVTVDSETYVVKCINRKGTVISLGAESPQTAS